MSTERPDRIEKQILLEHPRSRVWRALTDSKEFGKWFGAHFEEPFRPGGRLRGRITHKGYEHLTMDIAIERMEPERLFSWWWRPGSPEPADTPPGKEPPGAPSTLVVFELEEVDGGTLLKVTESGFDRIPLERRARAFRENEGGWKHQMEAIKGHLDGSS